MLEVEYVLVKTIKPDPVGCNKFMGVTIIPGNINSSLEREKLIFHQLLPLGKWG
jgi:hypothetical protein